MNAITSAGGLPLFGNANFSAASLAALLSDDETSTPFTLDAFLLSSSMVEDCFFFVAAVVWVLLVSSGCFVVLTGDG